MAIHFACSGSFAKSELVGRVIRLTDLKNRNWQGKNFDVCDDVSSGFMQGYCAAKAGRFQTIKRNQILKAIKASFDRNTLGYFDRLNQKFDDFIRKRSRFEIDLSGTGRAAFSIAEEEFLREDMLHTLQQFQQGNFPIFGAGEQSAADKELNLLYQKALRQKISWYTTVTAKGIYTTQISWLKFRAAFLDFAKATYPTLSLQSLDTLLIKKRCHML